MKILLDTHHLLWSLFESHKIYKKEREIILNPSSIIFVSLISLWEINLKYSLGKLEMIDCFPEEIPYYIDKSGFKILPLKIEEVSSFYKLPKLHKDPFDRLIIW